MFNHISTEKTHELIEQNKATIVDIRDPQSFAMGHIEQAQHLTNENLNDFVATADKQQPLVVVCYHGNSSQQAAEFLSQQGFVDVYSMDGGFTQWQLSYPDKVAIDS